MKRKQRITPLLGRVLVKIAPKIGAKVILEPQWNIVGQIIFKNGRKRYFRYSSLDLNPLGAAEISKDKGFSTYFLKKLGYPTIPGEVFYSDSWARLIHSKDTIHAAYHYATQLGFPVIVKPNNGSQGVGVAKVYTKQEFYKALRVIFKNDDVALVQEPMPGKDYRIVVLDSKVISAYQRIPLSVMGDGKSTIRQLLTRKQAGFIKSGRDTKIKMNDFRIAQKLRRQGLSPKSVLAEGERVFLLDNANLSAGGDSIDVTEVVHPALKKIAVRITRDMGLRFCGVDLLVEGDVRTAPKKYHVLETNAAPGLDHYALTGRKQERIVEDLYIKVLRALEKA